MEQLISNQFHQSIEAKIDHVELLVEPLQAAATLITNSLLQEGKLLVCAEGICESLASTIVHCMLNGQRLERPGLPAMVLSPGRYDPGRYEDESADDPFSGQIRTLGKPGDVLIIISSGLISPALFCAVQSAQAQNIGVIALTAPGREPLIPELHASDVELFVNNDNQYRIQEIQLLILFCLCELIESNLFGEVY